MESRFVCDFVCICFFFIPRSLSQILRLHSFIFFFLPLSWCLAFLNSLYLSILLKPKPICLKLLSQINGSLSLAQYSAFLSL